MKCLGFQQITDLSSAVGLILPEVAEGVVITEATVQATAQNVRIRLDGNDASATVGQVLVANAAPLPIRGDALANFSAFEVAGGAKLEVHYFG